MSFKVFVRNFVTEQHQTNWAAVLFLLLII